METHYCWRCRIEMPMLDEAEWAEVSPYRDSYISAINACREEHEMGLAEARERISEQACAVFKRLTGFHETNYLAIYHHRLSLYGPPCPECGRLLRTPKAAFCVYCGFRPHERSLGNPLQKSPPFWSVWRQDDSGTKFLMGTRLTETEATAMVADFEARGHKQTYWCAIASGSES